MRTPTKFSVEAKAETNFVNGEGNDFIHPKMDNFEGIPLISAVANLGINLEKKTQIQKKKVITTMTK